MSKNQNESKFGNLVVATVIVTLFPVGILYLNNQPGRSDAINAMVPGYMQNKTQLSNSKATVNDLDYDFYELLPKIEVDVGIEVPDTLGASALLKTESRFPSEEQKQIIVKQASAKRQDIAAAKKIAEQAAVAARVTKSGGSLQVGSFRQRNQAESMRARLAMLGFRSQLAPAVVNGNRVVRVILGPMDADRFEQAEFRLARAGIEFSIAR